MNKYRHFKCRNGYKKKRIVNGNTKISLRDKSFVKKKLQINAHILRYPIIMSRYLIRIIKLLIWNIHKYVYLARIQNNFCCRNNGT